MTSRSPRARAAITQGTVTLFVSLEIGPEAGPAVGPTIGPSPSWSPGPRAPGIQAPVGRAPENQKPLRSIRETEGLGRGRRRLSEETRLGIGSRSLRGVCPRDD